MTSNRDAKVRHGMNFVPVVVGLVLALHMPSSGAQTPSSDVKAAEVKAAEVKAESYRTVYLANITQQNDANEIQTALRNMIPKAKIYYLPSQGALSIRAGDEDMQLAQKIVADLDRTRKTYRLTYKITQTDDGKRVGEQHFALLVVSGGKTWLKQGSRLPVVTGYVGGSGDAGSSKQDSQVTYVDVGLNIEASLDGYPDGVRLHSKVEQSSLADEKSGIGSQDPVIRQSTLDATSTLEPGKPLVLGSLDMPGTARHMDVEVVSELVR
jgi:type II secretory pathway component GspD/PulD (secretin)